MTDRPAGWRMPAPKQIEKLANAAAVRGNVPQVRTPGPGDEMPPEYWQVVLDDASTDREPLGPSTPRERSRFGIRWSNEPLQNPTVHQLGPNTLLVRAGPLCCRLSMEQARPAHCELCSTELPWQGQERSPFLSVHLALQHFQDRPDFVHATPRCHP